MTVLSLRSPTRALIFALATGAVGCESDSDSTTATSDTAQAADATDGATDVTDGATEAGDGVSDGSTDAVDGTTDAVDGTTDAVDGTTDAVDGTTDAVDGTTDGASDGIDGTTDGVVATCEEPGEVTTPTPVCDGATTTCNVELFECTRTAKALSCELSTEPQYSESIEGNTRIITANGVPTHDVGPFPNSGNPNSISAQSYTFEVPVTPSGAGSSNVKYFGILTSGVVLDPGTAETWNDDGSWRYEALRYGTATGYFEANGGTDTTFHPDGLGLDCNLAHVQPTGAYHYHGVPTSFVPTAPAVRFIGWAADGYPIIALFGYDDATDVSSEVREMLASWQLKSGSRPSGDAGPGGTYDGTFGADWEYVQGSGDLDQCNGRSSAYEDATGNVVTGYHYVLTRTFPFIPRCTTAAADASFTQGDGGMPPGGGGIPACTPGQTKCCGDGVCDGPETAANCSADCS